MTPVYTGLTSSQAADNVAPLATSRSGLTLAVCPSTVTDKDADALQLFSVQPLVSAVSDPSVQSMEKVPVKPEFNAEHCRLYSVEPLVKMAVGDTVVEVPPSDTDKVVDVEQLVVHEATL
jgi:hypothetical protein